MQAEAIPENRHARAYRAHLARCKAEIAPRVVHVWGGVISHPMLVVLPFLHRTLMPALAFAASCRRCDSCGKPLAPGAGYLVCEDSADESTLECFDCSAVAFELGRRVVACAGTGSN